MKIMDIKRFAVHDGDGIRTTFFFKGCPLRCLWCHNPEGLNIYSEIAYFSHKCINCGMCTNLCNANKIENGIHVFKRNNCVLCGKCENVCPQKALILYGKEFTVDELVSIALEDKEFYDNSGGGVTLSGGECLLQADACRELLFKLKENGIHTAVDTSGAVPWSNIEKVIDYTDIFLYDIKAFDEDVHKKCTGQSNEQILENLKRIDKFNKKIEIRIPYVPKFNSEQMEKIARFVGTLNNVSKVKLLPYHNFMETKRLALDIAKTNERIDTPTKEMLEEAKAIFTAYNIPTVY